MNEYDFNQTDSVVSEMNQAILSIIMMLATTAAIGGDARLGEWGGNCGSDVQCWISIEPIRVGYNIAWIVADRMDASRIICRTDYKARRSPDPLKGTASDGGVISVTGGGASIRVTGIKYAACAGQPRQITGEYFAIGD